MNKEIAWEQQEHTWKVNSVKALPRTAFMAGYEAAEKRECVWTQSEQHNSVWKTTCGLVDAYYQLDLTYGFHEFTHCPNCGGKVRMELKKAK